MPRYRDGPKLKTECSKLLTKACREAIAQSKTQDTKPEFKEAVFARSFFRLWYHDTGYPYFFIFRKNRSVTNISYAELAALIRPYTEPKPLAHCQGSDDTRHDPPSSTKPAAQPQNENSADIQFDSSKSFLISFHNLWSSLGTTEYEGNNYEERYNSLAKHLHTKCEVFNDLYFPILHHLVLYDAYYGSSLIHVPKTLTLDSLSLCSQAGYVHSCGSTIYFRNTRKASLRQLLANLEIYLNEQINKGQEIYLIPYSHEFFDSYENDLNKLLPNGLEDLRIYLERFHVGEHLLVDVLQYMRQKFKGRLFIPKGQEDFRRERTHFKKTTSHPDNSTTIFLMVDRSLNEGNNHFPGEEQYPICFAQEAVNNSPLISFNEAKPAWIAPVTIPHTLAAAMLNIARTWLPTYKQEPVTILDPFSGSGTFLLEALKVPNNIHFIATDKHFLSGTLISDNLHFFSKPHDWLYSLSNSLMNFAQHSRIPHCAAEYTEMPGSGDASRIHGRDEITEMVSWSVKTTLAEIAHIQDEWKKMAKGTDRSITTFDKKRYRLLFDWHFTEHFWRSFVKSEDYFVSRLIFYVVWKALIKMAGTFAFGTEGYEKAVMDSIEDFRCRIEKLARIRFIDDTNTGQYDYQAGHRVCMQPGLFSREAIIPFRRFEVWFSDDFRVDIDTMEKMFGTGDKEAYCWESERDALAVLEKCKAKVDLIITNPPYGFNTDPENAVDFARFYKKLVRKLVRALRPDGQLVLCLPQQSRTGQVVPFFVTKDMIMRQVFYEAEQDGKMVVQESLIKPPPEDCFVPPFYWRSEKVLTRSILHFRVRPKG